MKATLGSKRQYAVSDIVLSVVIAVAAVVSLFLCLANGDAGAVLGALTVFGMLAVVVAVGGPQGDLMSPIQRRRALGWEPSAASANARPASELATQSKCWRFWPKNGNAKELATRSMCWNFWPANSH